MPAEEAEYTVEVKFILADVNGAWPDLTLLASEQSSTSYLHDRMTLCVLIEDSDGGVVIKGHRVIDPGLEASVHGPGIQLEDGSIVGYPHPVVAFVIETPPPEGLEPRDILRMVGETFYKVTIGEQGEDMPVYFEDHGPHSTVVAEVGDSFF